MVKTDARTACRINLCLKAITDTQLPCGQLTDMTDCLTIFLCILDAKFSILPFQQTGIAYLATRFAIEWRFINTTTAS